MDKKKVLKAILDETVPTTRREFTKGLGYIGLWELTRRLFRSERRETRTEIKDTIQKDEKPANQNGILIIQKDQVEKAKSHLSQAMQNIENMLRDKPEWLRAYRDIPDKENLFLAMVEKESDFNPNPAPSKANPSASRKDSKGYIQPTATAVREVNTRFKTNYALDSLGQNPTTGIEVGLLFYLMQYHESVPKRFHDEATPAGKVKLALLFYNGGYGNVFDRQGDTKNYEELYRKMEADLKLAYGSKKTQSETVLDPRYGVNYRQAAGVEKYLENTKISSGKTIGKVPLEKVAIMLRYAELVYKMSKDQPWKDAK